MLGAYGSDVSRYIRAIAGPLLSDDAYSQFAVDLWRGLPSFEWHCTARAFAYTLARHAVVRARLKAARAARWEQVFAEARWLEQEVTRTRTPTPVHRQSEVKERLRALRDRLPEEERTLLILRVDRDLSFKELVEVFGEEAELATEEDRKRFAATLRKRFQAVKEKLRKMMQEEGLIRSGS